MKPCTQADVARKLKISQRTVATVLGKVKTNSTARVSDRLRRRILQASQKLGYTPHLYAQALRNKRSGLIGLLQFGATSNLNNLRIHHLTRLLQQQGCMPLHHCIDWFQGNVKPSLDFFHGARAEGIILISPPMWIPRDGLALLSKCQIPMTVMDGMRLPGVPQIRSDIRQGMRDLTRHLLEQGHLQLTLQIRRWKDNPRERSYWQIQERIQGFQDAINAFETKGKNVKGGVFYAEGEQDWRNPYEMGYRAMEQLLAQRPRPHATLCGNDLWAVGAMACCAAKGLKIPDDMAITGFDNDAISEYTVPSLTTVEQQNEILAVETVRLLMERINPPPQKKNPEVIKVPCRLIVRASSGKHSKT
ncbi:MAG: LacI family DNA-binding transcriptional regulator [Verrucomicrobiae bacterium]|nr:LacI family DNA-binding transcriptional regulator [Verrucomicrobiae bacterium]